MCNVHDHWLFDVIYFPLGCYRKNLKKPLMIYLMWLYLCLLPFFEAITSCCWRSYCYCWELLHSGFPSVEKTLPSLQCVMNEIHVVGFAFYLSMHGITWCSGVHCGIVFCLAICFFSENNFAVLLLLWFDIIWSPMTYFDRKYQIVRGYKIYNSWEWL